MACSDWKLEARYVPGKGRGVFPGVAIPAHELVLKFRGTRLHEGDVPRLLRGDSSRHQCLE